MKSSRLFLLAALPAFRMLVAEGFSQTPSVLEEASTALAEGIPQVAALRAEELLADAGLPVGDRDAATLLLARALLDLHQPKEALAQLRPLTARAYPGAALLQARALGALGHWKEAQSTYRALSQSGAISVEASLGEAEALQALGRPEEALSLFRTVSHQTGQPPLLQLRIASLLVESRRKPEAETLLHQLKPGTPEEQKWKSYLEGRLLLLQDQAAPALTLFRDIAQARDHLPESLNVAAAFGATEARIALYGSEEADREMETFIWRNPTSPYLDRAFCMLAQVYALQEDPPEGEYHRWAAKNQPQRTALARFHVAKLQFLKGKFEKANETLAGFILSYPEHPLLPTAYLLHADVLSAQGNLAEAARALDGAMRHTDDPETRAEIELRSGLINYQQGEYMLAAQLFETAATRSPMVETVATFDSALAWVARRNFEHFQADSQRFSLLQPTSPLRAELALEEGLARARVSDPAAQTTLETFLQHFPQEARSAEARLALAELKLFPPGGGGISPRAAEESLPYLQVISTSAGDPEVQAQADYLAIWMIEGQEPKDLRKVIVLARAFQNKYPRSAWLPAVRMKLGQLYFNREDFANAETYFTQLVQDAPNSEFAEPALFLSGQAAARLMNTGAADRALAAFDAVVKREGPLKLYARQEQANIQSRLSHEDQAIALYDLILAADPAPDAQLRQATYCGKADNLVTLGRRLNLNEKIESALAVYAELSALPDVGPVWRNQALFKKGKALEQLGRKDDAILAYYDVLKRSATGEREYFWLYKAGFEAARLFEQQEEWKSAVGICEKMAAFVGPRSSEVRAHLKQLRLDHFIWD